MILRMSFEELTAANSAAERLLSSPDGGGVAAPPEVLSELEGRLPLEGDISVSTLAEQRRLLAAVDHLLGHLKRRMDTLIQELYVGADDAVNAYFDYANVLTLRPRLVAMGDEMTAAIVLVTGSDPTRDMARTLSFPD